MLLFELTTEYMTRLLLQRGAHFYMPQTKSIEKSKLLQLAPHTLVIRKELKQRVS